MGRASVAVLRPSFIDPEQHAMKKDKQLLLLKRILARGDTTSPTRRLAGVSRL